MKKVLYVFISVTLMLTLCRPLEASTPNITIEGNDTFTDEITLNINLNDFSQIEKIYGLEFKLEYSDSITLEKIETLENFEMVKNNKVIVYSSSGTNEGTIVKLTFKNNNLNINEVAYISLKEIIASDGEADIKIENVVKTIKLEEEKKEIPVFEAKAKASVLVSSNKEINTNNEEEKKENKIALTNLNVSSGSLNFNPDVLSYNISVENDIEQIEINAESLEGIKIEGSGTYTLKEGDNPISIKISDEDGNTKTYTVNVSRKKSANLLEETVFEEDETFISKHKVPIILVSLMLLFIIIGVIVNKKEEN